MLAETLIKYLNANGITFTSGVNAFVDFLPEKPTECLVIMEYEGDPPSRYDIITHRSFQIGFRSSVAATAKQHANAAHGLFSPTTDDAKITMPNVDLVQVYPRGTVFRIDTDPNGNAIYGFNVGITSTIKD